MCGAVSQYNLCTALNLMELSALILKLEEINPFLPEYNKFTSFSMILHGTAGKKTD